MTQLQSQYHVRQKPSSKEDTFREHFKTDADLTSVDAKKFVETANFHQHFDLEEMLTAHCNISVCYKLGNKRLFLKNLRSRDLQL